MNVSLSVTRKTLVRLGFVIAAIALAELAEPYVGWGVSFGILWFVGLIIPYVLLDRVQ